MDEEQIVIAEELLNNLLSLGTLVQVADNEIVADGPLFCLPKAGVFFLICAVVAKMKPPGPALRSSQNRA
jgi:hypothetical protein